MTRAPLMETDQRISRPEEEYPITIRDPAKYLGLSSQTVPKTAFAESPTTDVKKTRAMRGTPWRKLTLAWKTTGACKFCGLSNSAGMASAECAAARSVGATAGLNNQNSST
jgi:hypothetical protein